MGGGQPVSVLRGALHRRAREQRGPALPPRCFSTMFQGIAAAGMCRPKASAWHGNTRAPLSRPSPACPRLIAVPELLASAAVPPNPRHRPAPLDAARRACVPECGRGGERRVLHLITVHTPLLPYGAPAYTPWAPWSRDMSLALRHPRGTATTTTRPAATSFHEVPVISPPRAGDSPTFDSSS